VNPILVQLGHHAQAAGVILPARVTALQAAIARLQAQAGELRRRSPAAVNLAFRDQAQLLAEAAVAGKPLEVGKAAARVSEAQWQVSEAAQGLPLLAESVGQLERQLLLVLREEADAIHASLQTAWQTEIRPAATAAGATLRGRDLASDGVAEQIIASGDADAAAAMAALVALEARYRAMRDLQADLGRVVPLSEGFTEFSDGPHGGLPRHRTARLVAVAGLKTTWFPTSAQASAADADWQQRHDPKAAAVAQHAAEAAQLQATRKLYPRRREPQAVR
jgi:hypothetical protein